MRAGAAWATRERAEGRVVWPMGRRLTENMELKSLALDTSQSSGWLKLVAHCRHKGGSRSGPVGTARRARWEEARAGAAWALRERAEGRVAWPMGRRLT